MTRRLIALLAALCFLLSLTAAADVQPKGVFPVVDEPTTLRVAVVVSPKVEDIHTNDFTLWLQEQTGITLDILELSASDTAAQINTIMLSDDLPDAFIGYTFSYDELATYAAAGKLLALNDYIEQYGDEYFRFLEQLSANVNNPAAYVTVDGEIFAVPSASVMVTDTYASYRIRIPELFLNALDMEMPTTLDEFYDYLVAVRDNDANGNGDPNDEIPMSGHENRNWALSNIGCCFQYTDTYSYLKLNGDSVEFIAANDNFKKTVEYMKMLVDEGLLDPAIFTQNQAMELTLNTQEYPIIGADASYTSATYNATSELFNSLRIIPNLIGPDGYSAPRVQVPNVTASMVITTACRNPEAAFRMMDFLLNEETSTVARLGMKGVHWKEADEGMIGRNGEPARYQLIGTQVWTLPTNNSIWRLNNFIDGSIMNYLADDPNSSTGKLAADIRKYNLADSRTGEQIPKLLMDVETSAKYRELASLIVSYVDESCAKFILGDRSLDEWDAYVNELENMGVERYVEMAQAAYEAMN